MNTNMQTEIIVNQINDQIQNIYQTDLFSRTLTMIGHKIIQKVVESKPENGISIPDPEYIISIFKGFFPQVDWTLASNLHPLMIAKNDKPAIYLYFESEGKNYLLGTIMSIEHTQFNLAQVYLKEDGTNPIQPLWDNIDPILLILYPISYYYHLRDLSKAIKEGPIENMPEEVVKAFSFKVMVANMKREED